MQPARPEWCWVLSPDYIERLSRERWTLRAIYCPAAELADFFHVRNVVFFHPGDHQASLLEPLRKYDEVICNVGDPCFLKDAERQVAKAGALSKLSLEFPNIVGGIVDDFSTAAVEQGRMPPDLMQATAAALKSSNAALRLLAVVYAGHLESDLSAYLPCIDVINLWVWKSSELKDLDAFLAKAERRFPGKPIHLGLYLYDYGETCDTLPLELVQFQVKRARQYLADGRIEGFHLLGCYLKDELHTAQARWVAAHIAAASSPGCPAESPRTDVCSYGADGAAAEKRASRIPGIGRPVASSQ